MLLTFPALGYSPLFLFSIVFLDQSFQLQILMLQWVAIPSGSVLCAAFPFHVASGLLKHLAKSQMQSMTCRVQVLQPRSYCLQLPNTSSYTDTSFTPKLLTSALSKAVPQLLLYTHFCSLRELLHAKQWIHSSAATSSLLTIYSGWRCPDHTAKWDQEKNLDTEMIALYCHQNTLFPDLKFPTKHWPNNASLVSSANLSASWCFNVTIYIAYQEQVVEISKATIKTSLPQECQLDFKGWCILFKFDQKCKDQRSDEVGKGDHHGRQILH